MEDKEKTNITVGYYHALDEKQITIPLEEYKELLIIKGKYEELKSQYPYYKQPTITFTGGDDNNRLKYPYEVTC